MIAFGFPEQMSHETGRILSINEQMARYYWQIFQECKLLTNTAQVFHYDPQLYPMQCETAIQRLSTLRSQACQVQAFLAMLDPEDIRLLRPYGCINKLAIFDQQLSELLVVLATFRPVCCASTKERIGLQMYQRSLWPPLITTYHDVVSQLAVLLSSQRLQSHTQQGEGGNHHVQ